MNKSAGQSIIEEVSRALDAFEPGDLKASESKAEIQRQLAVLPDPFSETADRTHVTASAVVISSAGVLLHKHKRFGIWVGPGGHIDPGESPSEAVLRETLEETGIVARHPQGGPTLIHLDVHDGPKGHVHLDTRWLLLAEPDTPTPGEEESPEVYWVPVDEALVRVPKDFVHAITGAVRFLET